VAYEVKMPQMGESIAEGTITSWHKKVGERVERDEPLFEISTDKVDAEIPSPAAGILREIRVQPGQTVPIQTVVAILDESGAAASPTPVDPNAAVASERSSSVVAPSGPAASARPAAAPSKPAPPPQMTSPDVESKPAPPAAAREEGRPVKSSPLVRKIAAEHGVDIASLAGTGLSGRVTKQDLLDHLSKPTTAAVAAPLAAAVSPSSPALRDAPSAIPDAYRARLLPGDRVEEMSTMRSRIAEHMILSRRVSAHVHTVWDMDLSRVSALRAKHKQSWSEQHGVPLTYTAFFMYAVVEALKAFAQLNASLDGSRVIYHHPINLGFAVALEHGLIVPVIHGADELNLLGLARRASELAERARSKKLAPNDVQNGTFTLTNPGIYGPLFNLPVINQPQVAILGVGAVEKRPVVIDDMLAIRTRCHLSLGFDHRLVDGAVADQFMRKVHGLLAAFDEGQL